MNAGGETISPPDGPDWIGADSGSPYISGSPSTYDGYSGTVDLDSSVPDETPTELFNSELYGDQQWTFEDGIESGEQYEVRLYFAEIFHDSEGERVFDVAIEGETVLSEYDIAADVGSETGVTKAYSVTPSDGDINIEFTTVTDNAKVSAVEIVRSEPQPDTLGGPSSVHFGTVLIDESATETVTVTNLGDDGDPEITIDDVSIPDGDTDEFSVDSPSQTTLAPGESSEIPVTFSPSDAQEKSATLEVSHSGVNDPVTVTLTGDGVSDIPVGFSGSQLDGFSAGNPTALDFGPDDRLYVSTQGGTV